MSEDKIIQILLMVIFMLSIILLPERCSRDEIKSEFEGKIERMYSPRKEMRPFTHIEIMTNEGLKSSYAISEYAMEHCNIGDTVYKKSNENIINIIHNGDTSSHIYLYTREMEERGI